MIELINGIYHYPVTTYSTDNGNVVARDLYPHRARTRIVESFGSDSERAERFAAHLNKVNQSGGNPLIA